MIPKRFSSPTLAAVILGLMLTACAQTQPSRFYTLSSLSDTATTPSAASNDLAIGVGPISLPNYLNRPEIVRRSTPNEFQVAEFDRWGEQLQDVFPRVMAENLAELLATDRVFLLPQRRATTIDYQVEVNVTRFDADVGGPAILAARWEIFDDDGKSLVVDRSTFTETVEGDGYGAVATAMSRTVAAFSQEIAAAITALSRRS
jgi:uncharacterized lipoprotein YmbA